MTGKKTSRAAIIIFESGLVTPNQELKMGAMAMIGIALAATANGSTASRAFAHRATANATTTPTSVPMTSPPIASKSVVCADWKSGQRPAPQLSTRAAPIADGAGRMRARTWKMRTASSHSAMPPTNTMTAGR